MIYVDWSNIHDVIDWCKKNADKKGYVVGEIKIVSNGEGFTVTILYVSSVSAVLPRSCMRYKVNVNGEVVKTEQIFV